uniref:Eukaryotic translation initiation factor 3 subunit M n=1 Tax=Cyanoptyche gloeocystis TaxID=77922 RepID=A0A7S2JLI2_9EUKA|mmetsp:Transcript_2064/g.3877  ORF Transcript_2064/g.3877 Transcript_2064/m.3877 type:complete len:407 (+) Transcript_2064:50-1270(+)
MATTILTELSDEEAIVHIARHFAKVAVAAGKTDCESLAEACEELLKEEEVKWEDVLDVVSEPFDLVCSQTADKETEAAFNVLCHLAVTKADPEYRDIFFSQLAKNIASSTNHTAVRTRMLVSLFNQAQGPQVKYSCLYHLLTFTASIKNADTILPYLKDADTWISSWQLDEQSLRKLLLTISNTLKEADKGLESYRYLVKYLSRFEHVDPDALGPVKADAARAAVEAVRLPNLYQMGDLFDLKVVRQLADDPTYSREYELLKIFTMETLAEFNAFWEKHSAHFASLEVSHEHSLRKIRVLTLTSLAASHEQLTYAEVAEALQVDEAEVETWLILAFSAQLVSAKMDQVKRLITIDKCVQRYFSPTQWREIKSKLVQWRDAIRPLLTTVLPATTSTTPHQHLQRLDR